MAGLRRSDPQIITAIKKGDTHAYRILVNRYKDVSFALACTILPREADAEDALQESFIKAYRGLANFKGKSRFSTWLYRIVVNTCYDRKAQLQTSPFQNDTPSRIYEQIPDFNSPSSPMDRQDRKNIINRIMSHLKAEEALLLRLYYLSELSIAEIQEVTSYKNSRVKVTLYRARNNFRKHLVRIFGTEIEHEL